MKHIAKDSSLVSEAMSRTQVLHEILSMARVALKDIEELMYTLEGETYGELTVRKKTHRVKQEEGAQLNIPSWKCDCSCGAEVVASHLELIEGTVTSCGHETKGE